MSLTRKDTATRTLSEISEVDTVRISLDLVSAARRNIRFLRTVTECQWLNQEPVILEAIRRYEELWMPLISDLTVGPKAPMVLPPIDVEWVWFCHTLNPVSYGQYCESRFSKLIGRPAIFDEENEDYAVMRCKKIWNRIYLEESFENEADSESPHPDVWNNELYSEVKKYAFLYHKFSGPYMPEIVYLMAARQRYKGFLLMFLKFKDECCRLVPTIDILLMWLTHQSHPTVYSEDLKEIWNDVGKVVGSWVIAKERDVDKTKELWDKTFHQPYEKAGGELAVKVDSFDPPFYWVVSDADVNTKYKSMLPRFQLEFCLFMRLNSKAVTMEMDTKCNFLRLRMARCHRELKLDEPLSSFCVNAWHKASRLYCEFGTRGLILELRHKGGSCFKRSRIIDSVTLHWNDLLRAESLTLARLVGQQARVVASITPPVQASYLLKCVPDRVTDDSGAMISDLILRSNNYRPQEGRWLSRTVLDHAGRECFVVRIRAGSGFWRRGAETPSAVKWEDRITEVREGSWSYVAGCIGKAPEKVVETVKPKEPPEDWQSAWEFSTGEELLVRWDSGVSTCGIAFCLKSPTSAVSSAMLLPGRKLEFQVKKNDQESDDKQHENHKELDVDDGEEESFVTLIRVSDENPSGKATALINYKLLAVEILPEEDAVFVLLLCISLLRSISEMRKEDIGRLLVRRRLKEAKPGDRDWGSVVVDWKVHSAFRGEPYVEPWYWNSGTVTGPERGESVTRQPVLNYSLVEGGDLLYKQAILNMS